MTAQTIPAINPRYKGRVVWAAVAVAAIAIIRLASWANDYRAQTAAEAQKADAPEVSSGLTLEKVQCGFFLGYQDFDLLPSERRNLASLGYIDLWWHKSDGAVTACAEDSPQTGKEAHQPELGDLVHIEGP